MPSNWVILHAGALGDLILTLQAVLRTVIESDDPKIDVLSRTNPGDLSGLQPSINRRSLDTVDAHWLHRADDAEPPSSLSNAIENRSVFSALADRSSRVHAQLARLRPRRLISIDPRPDIASQRHITEQWSQQIAPQIAEHAPDRDKERDREKHDYASIRVPHEFRDRRRARWGYRIAVIHPGSGGREKCWSLTGFLDTGHILQHRGFDVRFVIGEVELERWDAAERRSIADRFPLDTPTEPDDLLQSLIGSAVFVGNDAGPAHLAAFLHTPTVTIFGPTAAAIWRPLGPSVETISGDPRRAASWGITAEQVAASVQRLVAAPHATP